LQVRLLRRSIRHRTNPPWRTSTPPALSTLLICVGLVAVTLALFFPAIHFPFITYDDQLYVVDNAHVHTGLQWSNITWAFSTWHTGNWHPLTWFSLMADAQLFGKNAGAYHFTNVLLHAANSVLLFLALGQLTGSQWRSAFVAALFAVHPLHVESVAWISERKDVLSAFLFLLAMAAYGRYVARPSAMRYALVTLLFLLGLLAKSMLVTLPFVLLVLDAWPLARIRDQKSAVRGQKNWSALVLEKVPLLAIAAALSVVTFLAQKSAGSTMPMTVYPLSARIQNALFSYERYLGKIFWPHDLVLPYPFSRSLSSLELCWAAALLVAICFIAIKTAQRRGYLFTGWFWFMGTLLPVIGLIQVGPQAMADRYMYLPAIGIFIAVTWGFADATSAMRLPPYVNSFFGSAVVVVLAWLSFQQLAFWKNSETLFRHSLAINPGEIVASRNLAIEYASQHRRSEAITTLQSLLIETPYDPWAHFQLGQVLQQMGEDRQAADEYETAIKLSAAEDRHHVLGSALNNLAWIRATSADPALRDGADAVHLAERSCVLTIAPDAGQLDTLAAAYAEAGDFNRATDTGLRALELAKRAGDNALTAEIEQHLGLYRSHKPYRTGSY
jgi:tetratricopeptide (TPR) repeat protein